MKNKFLGLLGGLSIFAAAVQPAAAATIPFTATGTGSEVHLPPALYLRRALVNSQSRSPMIFLQVRSEALARL